MHKDSLFQIIFQKFICTVLLTTYYFKAVLQRMFVSNLQLGQRYLNSYIFYKVANSYKFVWPHS